MDFEWNESMATGNKDTVANLNQLVREWWSQHIMIEDLKMTEAQ